MVKLSDYISKNCSFVSREEEKEIVEFMREYDKSNVEFLEVTLEDIL